MNEQTWQAFWMTAIEEKDPNDVAETLGMERGAVYVAKSRVIARMKQAVEAAARRAGRWMVAEMPLPALRPIKMTQARFYR